MIAPEDLLLSQTPVNFSEPGFDARSIFQLHVVPDAARRSQGASKQLHVACDHTKLVNGKLYLPTGGQLVFGPACQQVTFQDVTITGPSAVLSLSLSCCTSQWLATVRSKQIERVRVQMVLFFAMGRAAPSISRTVSWRGLRLWLWAALLFRSMGSPSKHNPRSMRVRRVCGIAPSLCLHLGQARRSR